MPIVSNFTNLQGTKQLKENPLVEEFHTFKPLNILNHIFQINFLSDIFLINAYSIFSLFFSDQIFNIIAQNTNKYAHIQKANLKRKYPDIHPKKP